jgi:hypothetical protein
MDGIREAVRRLYQVSKCGGSVRQASISESLQIALTFIPANNGRDIPLNPVPDK